MILKSYCENSILTISSSLCISTSITISHIRFQLFCLFKKSFAIFLFVSPASLFYQLQLTTLQRVTRTIVAFQYIARIYFWIDSFHPGVVCLVFSKPAYIHNQICIKYVSVSACITFGNEPRQNEFKTNKYRFMQTKIIILWV